MSEYVIRKGASTLVILESPHDELTDPPEVISAGTVTARLFDDSADSELSADEATSQTIISVVFPGLYAAGDTVRIELDDGTFDEPGITSVDAAGGTILIDSGLTSAAATGNRIAKKLGADVSMSAFGTPVLRSFNPQWGFKGSILLAHGGLVVGQNVRVEISYSSGAGLEVFSARVVGPF